MTRSSEVGFAAATGSLLTFVVAAALVGVRGEVRPEVIAVTLAATVAVCGRFGGRQGGVASALMAATSFDFLHTRPYLSLKIDNGSDILLTFVLLGVGIVVGGLAGQAADAGRRARDTGAQNRLRRVLATARDGTVADVEAVVCTELVDLLELRSCRFVAAAGDASSDAGPTPDGEPVVGRRGELGQERLVFSFGRGRGGLELPETGIAIEITSHHHRFGYLICMPRPMTGVSFDARRTAVELGDVLALALRADARTP